jgi:hypothetical protein
MNQRHPHADVIIAWANGEEIEVGCHNEWFPCPEPAWCQEDNYRIKPKRVKKEGWVNVYGDGVLGWRAYPTEKEANTQNDLKGLVACIRIEWEEDA